MKTLKQHIKEKSLEDFEEDLTGEEMKTFKQHMKEDHGYAGGQVGTATSVSPEDSNIGAHNIHDPQVMEKVNAFVSSICTQEYINPKAAMEQLANKLATIGLSFRIPSDGNATVEVAQFGGRFGKDTDGSDINDDGISHKKEGGLKIEFKSEKLTNGSSKVYAKLV